MEQRGSSPHAGPSNNSTTVAHRGKSSSPSSRGKDVGGQVGKVVHALNDVSLDERDLDHDVALLVSDWLHSRPNTSLAEQFDRELLGQVAQNHRSGALEEIERAVLDGDWGQLEGLISRSEVIRHQTQRAFLYMCYRQQFLEHIDNREFQKAFNLLQKRLKPLEHYQPFPYDFYNLCYLTSAGTVHDAPGLRDWGGPGPEREKLVGMWRDLIESSGAMRQGSAESSKAPQGRLMNLMRQAAAWQVSNTSHKGKQPWTVRSLLYDYEVRTVPNQLRLTVKGHEANVKCVAYIGGTDRLAISGSSDSTLRIFSTDNGETRHVLSGHTSRIWDCDVSRSTPSSQSSSSGGTEGGASLLASGSGDGTVRIWSCDTGDRRAALDGDCGDVYSVRWRPNRENQLVAGCYDRILRCWDVETRHETRTFSGHSQSVLSSAFDPTGNLLASGSKDKHVRLWDAVGGVCTFTVPASLGEITSVQFDKTGRYLLSGSKDNSNRLWDLRMQRYLYRYTGHQNTSKNLIRCTFAGPDDSLVISGSEDSAVYIWEREPSQAESNGNAGIDATTTNQLMSQSSLAKSPSGVISPYALGGGVGSKGDNHMHAAGGLRPVGDRGSGRAAGGGVNVRPLRRLRTGTGQGVQRQGQDQGDISAGGTAGAGVSVIPGLGQKTGTVFDVAWMGDGQMMSAGEDGSVQIWDTIIENDP